LEPAASAGTEPLAEEPAKLLVFLTGNRQDLRGAPPFALLRRVGRDVPL